MRLKFLLMSFFIFFSVENIANSKSITSEIKETNSNNNLISNLINKVDIHIVKEGDTLTSISKLYSIDKQIIIDANNLQNEDFIFIGQNLKISTETENIIEQNFHEIKTGDNLTEISNLYGVSIKDLIKLNSLENPDSLIVGSKLILNNDYSETNIEDNQESEDETNLAINFENKIYGPLSIKSESLVIRIKIRLLNATHKNGIELIIALQCEKNQIDVKKKGGKWQGWQPAEKLFEKNLLKEYC